MADANDWLDDDDLGEEAPSGTDLVKELRKQNRNLAKQLKEMQTRDEERAAADRKGLIERALEDAGVHEMAAKYIPAEAKTADAVRAWIEENKPGLARREAAPQTTTASPETATTTRVESGTVDQMKTMQALAGGADESAGGTGKVTEADLMAAGSMDELMDLFKRGGAVGS